MTAVANYQPPTTKARLYIPVMSASSLARKNGSLINDFPTEILTMIFKMIHSDLLERETYRAAESDDELASLSFFPYSISTVCRHWDAVMAQFAEFWTRVVVWIDRPGHLELLKLSIKRAQSLEFHSISVIRSSQDSSITDPLEKNKVQDVLGVLYGHCSRSQSLLIKTLTTDSLPTHIRTAWNLQTLRLESHQRGRHTLPPIPLPISDHDHPVHCDNLSSLSLTGPIFVNLLRNEKWRQALWRRYLESFTVVHLRAEDGGENPFTFQELWSSFRNIRCTNLSWINVDVPYPSYTSDNSRSHHLHMSSLTFDTVPASVLRAFYHTYHNWSWESNFPQMQVQKFRNCSFYGCPRFEHFPYSTRIEVSGISNPDSLCLLFEIASILELAIYDCPGLDNSSILSLVLFPFQKTKQRIALPNLLSLEISDCPNFSVLVLQEFIKSRKICLPDVNEIRFLSLSGSCPPLSEEEKEWFKENVEEFENGGIVHRKHPISSTVPAFERFDSVSQENSPSNSISSE